MMAAGREAIEYNRALGITDPQILSRIGSLSANLCSRLGMTYDDLVAFGVRSLDEIENFANKTIDFGPKTIEHIFKGEIKASSATGTQVLKGFHYENSDSIAKVISGTEEFGTNGVYRAKIEAGGIIKPDNDGYSSFFPKSWSREDVIDAIDTVFVSNPVVGNKIEGTYRGVKIEMYTEMLVGPDGRPGPLRIITAFPSWPQ
jgi:hypothetical protein